MNTTPVGDLFVIYCENDNCILNKEYLNISGKEIVGLHNPLKAASFKTKKDAQKFIDEYVAFHSFLKISIDKLEKHIVEYNNWLIGDQIFRSFNIKNKALSVKYNGESPLEVLQWHINKLNSENDILYEDYKTWPDLYSVYNHIFGINSCEGGLWNFTIYVRKKSSYDIFAKEFDIMRNKNPSLTNDEGGIKYSIMDYKCGEGGDFAYLIDNKDDTFIIEDRRSSFVEKITLKEAFGYLRKHRYY